MAKIRNFSCLMIIVASVPTESSSKPFSGAAFLYSQHLKTKSLQSRIEAPTLRGLQAKQRSALEDASVVITPVAEAATIATPSRPDSSLPGRQRRAIMKKKRAGRGGGKNFENQQNQYAANNDNPIDLLNDIASIDKNQLVGKLRLDGSRMPPLSLASPSASFMPALVLNANYQPLSFTPLSLWSWQEAIKAVFRGKVTVVDVYDVKIRGVNIEIPLPSVIALNEFVAYKGVKPAFTKRNVYLRDEYKCQYCSRQFFSQSDLSIDHVHPRCLGGRLNWENAVTSCRDCNGRKGSRSVEDLGSVGMRLLRPPKVPSQYELSRIAAKLWIPRRKVHPTWKPFIEQRFESQQS